MAEQAGTLDADEILAALDFETPEVEGVEAVAGKAVEIATTSFEESAKPAESLPVVGATLFATESLGPNDDKG